jgi:serine/threonine protein kinase/tetratricopeptide (TPR) repeat protein
MNARLPSLDDIFFAAREVTNAEDRAAYLDRVCGEDTELHRRVERLLAAQSKVGNFLESPPPSPTVSVNAETVTEGPGQSIGPYKLMEQIGEGGMGVVYVAEQHQPVRRKVALKIIKPGMDSKPVVARFEAERQALAMMDHPNIARVFDGGTTPSGRPYFVMELVRGIPITDYCDEQKLTIRERLELFVLVCRAVQHAHQKGIIHRDLKPSNILITLHDGVPVPKVIDFGVAKATGQSLTDKTVYTAFAQLIGTPLYMSPEQVELSGLDVDTRSDVYSLGVLLYELLTGTTPFDAETLRNVAFDELRRIIREQEPQSPSVRLSSLGATLTTVSARRNVNARRLGPSLRGEVDWIVMKALEKDRRRRYETANDFASDVMRYLTDQPVEACPPSVWYRVRKFASRNRVALATSTVVATVLVLGTAVSTWMAIRATRAERAARQERDAATAAREAEALSRKRAEEAEKTARTEGEKAKAINEFLVKDLLVRAGERGRDDNLLLQAGLRKDKDAAAGRLTLREALDRAAEKVGERFRDLPLVEAALRITISDTYHGVSAWTECRTQAAAALAIYERTKGSLTAEALNATRRLGDALDHENKYSEAEPLLRKSLDGLRRVQGEEHSDTLEARENLAVLYFDERKFAHAETLLVKVLEGRRRILGEEHPDTIRSMYNLAGVYKEQMKFAQAEPLLVKVLEIGRRVQGEAHLDMLTAARQLGHLYLMNREFARSIPLLEDVLRWSRDKLGPDHPDTLDTMDNLGDSYLEAGRLKEATDLLEQAWARVRKRPDLPADLFAVISQNLGEAYQRAGQFANAESLYREALGTVRQRHKEASSDSAFLQVLLAGNLLEQQRYAEAEPVLRECLRFREQKQPDDWWTFSTKSQLGGCLLGQKKYAEAEPPLLAGYEGMRQREETIPPLIRKSRMTEAIQRLVQLYEETGKTDRADEWRRKLTTAKPSKPAEAKKR